MRCWWCRRITSWSRSRIGCDNVGVFVAAVGNKVGLDVGDVGGLDGDCDGELVFNVGDCVGEHDEYDLQQKKMR